MVRRQINQRDAITHLFHWLDCPYFILVIADWWDLVLFHALRIVRIVLLLFSSHNCRNCTFTLFSTQLLKLYRITIVRSTRRQTLPSHLWFLPQPFKSLSSSKNTTDEKFKSLSSSKITRDEKLFSSPPLFQPPHNS